MDKLLESVLVAYSLSVINSASVKAIVYPENSCHESTTRPAKRPYLSPDRSVTGPTLAPVSPGWLAARWAIGLHLNPRAAAIERVGTTATVAGNDRQYRMALPAAPPAA